MASKAMNDQEVMAEMNKMVAFIKQEAMEKAREINVKADEEFSIEKAKLVKEAQQSIDSQYEQKRKASEVSVKIAQSTQTNKARLRILQRREEHLQSLFEEARVKVLELQKDAGRYAQLLEGFIVQGLLQLLESKVTVYARKKDVSIVQDTVDGAIRQYKEVSGRDVELEVDGSLSDDIAGGVILTSKTRRITIDNTLDERLRLLEDRMLPEIRHDLYGPNENRKFFQ